MSPKTMKLLAKPMLFAAAFIWGTSFFIMKNTLDVMPVFFLLAVRFTAGAALLSHCPSTSRCAPAALGHHAWYDGSRGYPAAYKRLDCPERQMVDVIALVDWLETTVNPAQVYDKQAMSFDEAVQAAIELEGRRFSPLLTARLRDGRTAERIRLAFEEGRQDACRRIYDDARRAAPPGQTP